MDQQLFSRPSRVIGLHGIHFPGSQTSCTRNSCNFCLDNSFTSPTLFVAVVHVTRIVCSVVIFFFSPSTSSPFSNACAFVGVGRSCIVEVTRKGEPEGRRRGEDAAKMRSNATCARSVENAERIKFHRGKGREGISVFFPSSTPSHPFRVSPPRAKPYPSSFLTRVQPTPRKINRMTMASSNIYTSNFRRD